jgi:hypothetical protein
MKKLAIPIILTFTITFLSYSQVPKNIKNPSYNNVTGNGFVNITEINEGLGLSNTDEPNSVNFLGFTTVFGNKFTRNIFGGIGVGYYSYDSGQLFPLYLDYRYIFHLKAITPFIYTSGGFLVSTEDIDVLTKIFVNPGIGVSRSVSSRFEVTLSMGVNTQMGDHVARASFLNFRLGIIFIKNPF